MSTSNNNFFDTKVMGHPAGLFVLFFTEMWERFSYYGMRVLLVFFFTASLLDQGWGWPKEHALAIFGTYASLVYLSTMLGGYFADKIIGYRWAVVVGALLMTLGHGCMAVETPFFIYFGLVLLVFGSGFFKPNMTSIISEMYKDVPEKKDGAYTIFYMGVNAGAFFGIMLCGYLGEKIGWSYGFGVAGIFMFFGLLQFWFAQNIFGDIGKKPKKEDKDDVEVYTDENGGPKNPFTRFQQVLIIVCSVLGLTWILNDPISKITEGTYNIYDFSLFGLDGNNVIIIAALLLFVVLLIIRIPKYIPVVRDRMLAIVFFAFITMFFWALFEQAPGSLNLYARDYTQRILEGVTGDIFKVVDALITIVPLAIITYVLYQLFKRTFKKYALSNVILAFSFVIIWGLAIMKVYNDYKSASYVVEYVDNNGEAKTSKIVTFVEFAEGDAMPVLDNESVEIYDASAEENEKNSVKNNYLFNADNEELGEVFDATITDVFERDKIGAAIQNTFAVFSFTNANGKTLTKEVKLSGDLKDLKQGDSKQLFITHDLKFDNGDKAAHQATVKAKESAVEIGATWFNILNSLYIIALAPLFSRWWESKYNPTANGKYAIGMALLGLGMLVIAIGASGIEPGQKSAQTSMFILVFVYLFHTMGELCVSPVALSYVSKLVPSRMIAVMFGVWYLAVAIGMKLAGIFGELSEGIAKEAGISTFFWYLTGISVILSLLAWVTTPVIKKLMHGVR
ncbi:oligopeptide:H+ symporter [uncultured Psychroserpens sp.]|uniref:oligopeptide:H+ symporter n=1 Tax=uncultured Psychroserpens sp. TaxID=255436 RepID=UPI00261FA0F4|nr:oligopeptide:H+ symporter [uncultured Psychroserpens sp.]